MSALPASQTSQPQHCPSDSERLTETGAVIGYKPLLRKGRDELPALALQGEMTDVPAEVDAVERAMDLA